MVEASFDGFDEGASCAKAGAIGPQINKKANAQHVSFKKTLLPLVSAPARDFFRMGKGD